MVCQATTGFLPNELGVFDYERVQPIPSRLIRNHLEINPQGRKDETCRWRALISEH